MALPSYGGRGNLLYDPSSNYNWNQDWDYLSGLVGQGDAQANPESFWTRLLGERGYGGFGARDTVARGLFGRVADSYGAARLTNPELKFTDFAGDIDINRLLTQMSPQERGENPSNSAPSNVRWLPR